MATWLITYKRKPFHSFPCGKHFNYFNCQQDKVHTPNPLIHISFIISSCIPCHWVLCLLTLHSCHRHWVCAYASHSHTSPYSFAHTFLLSSFFFLVRNPIHHYSSLISLDLNSSATCLSPKINWQVFRAPRVKHSFPQLSSFPPGDLIIQNFLQTRAQAEIIVSQLQWDHKRKFQHSKYSKYMNFWDPAKFIKLKIIIITTF